ncbi:MAG: hypothetical protein H0X24_15885 [Ktedonobacterales bacterium]|nr:hypothetical protein [Ktedonobacterales bacterium]
MPDRPQWLDGWLVTKDGQVRPVRYMRSQITGLSSSLYVVASTGNLEVMGRNLFNSQAAAEKKAALRRQHQKAGTSCKQ